MNDISWVNCQEESDKIGAYPLCGTDFLSIKVDIPKEGTSNTKWSKEIMRRRL